MTIESPPVACRVTLILPDREMLPGRVDVVGDKALQLAMFATPRTPLRQVQRSRLFLEFINEHGVCRMTGSVEALRRGTGYGDEEDVYDVVRFTFAGPPVIGGAAVLQAEVGWARVPCAKIRWARSAPRPRLRPREEEPARRCRSSGT